MTNLTLNELVHYLDLTTNDPLVRRLVDMLLAGESVVVQELISAGMDPVEHTFKHDYDTVSPGEYIELLRSDIAYYKEEANDWETQHHKMKQERDRLSARTVVELLNDMQFKLNQAESDRNQATRVVENLKKKNAELEEKINVWSVMER